MRTIALFVTLVAAGCGSSSTPDAGAEVDAAMEADAGAPDQAEPPDAGVDGSMVAASQCVRPDFGTACDVSATTVPPDGDANAMGTDTVVVQTMANPRPLAPADISVYMPMGKQAPVLFFSHAYGATDVSSYDSLLRRLASHGIAVVYVPYYSAGSSMAVPDANAERYAQLWDGFTAAATQFASSFDLTRVGFAGHSFGGGATPEMARRGFVENGWGSAARFMFIMAPWYSWGTDYDTIPTDVKTIMQVYWDDSTNDHQIAVDDIWNLLPPTMEKSWFVVHSDTCTCGLNAGHVTPITAGNNEIDGGGDNGHDVWAVARRIEALAAYSLGDASAKAVAMGSDTNLGNFIGCGGRAVAPLEVSATPATSTCTDFTFLEADRCQYADPDVTCP